MKTKALKNTGKGMKMLCLALLLSVTFIWGYGIIVTDDALTGSMGVFTMLAGRFLLAAFLLFVLRACLFKTKQYARFTKKEIAAGALVGTLNFLGFFFQSVGLLYTDTAKSGMLTGGYVIVVPVVYCILRKKISVEASSQRRRLSRGNVFPVRPQRRGRKFQPRRRFHYAVRGILCRTDHFGG